MAKKSPTTKDLLGPVSGPTMAQAAQQYNAMHQHELNGTSFASPDGVPWPTQQAFNTQQTKQGAASAASEAKRITARQTNTANVKIKKGK